MARPATGGETSIDASTSNFGKWFGSRPFSSLSRGARRTRVYVGAGLRCTIVSRMRVRACVGVCRWTRVKSRPKGRPQAAAHSCAGVRYILSRTTTGSLPELAANIARHTARNYAQERALPVHGWVAIATSRPIGRNGIAFIGPPSV